MPRVHTPIPFIMGTGLVTWALSERAFWGRISPDDSVADSVATITAYTAVAALALVVVRRFAVADAARLFLVGAMLGWAVEGLVVGTLYAALPVTVAWTALAWHAPIAVVAGWCLLPRALASGGRRAVAAAAGGGLALGAWSAFMCVDAGVDPDPGEALATGVIVAGALAVGYGLQAGFRPGPQALRGGRPAVAVGLLVAVWAALSVVPAAPFAPLVIVPLFAGMLRVLRRDAGHGEGRPPVLGVIPGVPPRGLLHLLWMPPAAAAGSMLAAVTGTAPLLGPVIAVTMSVAGTVLLVWAVRATRTPSSGDAAGREALRM